MNCRPPPRMANTLQVSSAGTATPAATTSTARIRAPNACRPSANAQSPSPRNAPGRTKSIFCVHMTAAPRQSPPPRNQRRPGLGASSSVEQPAQQKPERAHERQEGRDVRTDLQRLLDEDRLCRDKQPRQKTHPAIGDQTSNANDEKDRQHGQRKREEAAEEQEVPGGFKGLVGRKPAEERRQTEVVPGRVMFEEVPVGNQALEHAPGRVGVLELVWVEDPVWHQGDARDEEGDGGEKDERSGNVAPRRGRLRQPLVLVLGHLAECVASDRSPPEGYRKKVLRARASTPVRGPRRSAPLRR